MQPPPSAPPAVGSPPFATGLSRGRVWVAARPVHGPADVARVLRALGGLRGVREAAVLQQRGDVADFVVDLGRPIAMAADLKATMGSGLRSCVRTPDGFVLELEPSPGVPPAAPGPTGAPLGLRRRTAPGAARAPARTPPATLPDRPTTADVPTARPAEETPATPRGTRRRTAARSFDGLTADRRCAILSVDRDFVIRSAAGGLFRAFVDEERPLVGRPIGDAVTAGFHSLMIDHLTAAWRGEPTAVTVRTPRGDRAVELRFYAPRSRGLGAACAVVAVDVTDEHEAASVARELDAVLDAIVTSAFEPTAIIGTDGRWLRLNPAFEALLGYREQTLRGRPAADVTQIDDRSREAYLRDRAEQDGTATFELEKRLVRADGGVIVVHARTTIVRDGDAIHGYVAHVVPDGVADALPRPEPPEEKARRGFLRRPK